MSVRRILMTTDAIGGVWTYAIDLSRALGEVGIETILVTTGPGPSDAQRRTVAAIETVRLIETDAPLDWLAPDAAAIATAGHRIAALARSHDVDLVQVNAPALAAGVAFDRPVVVATHSCLATWWDAVESGLMPEDFRWRVALTQAGLLAADAVVAPSHAFAATTRRVHRLPVMPHVVHNGRASVRAVTRPETIADYAFTAGRLWDRGKNLVVLDRAAELGAPIVAAGPLIGPGGDGMAFDHLMCLGSLDPAALNDRIAARPIFVSAALYEPFGLAILEAAQAGCALVLSDIPTFRELWDGAALFVPAREAPGFAGAIEGLLADPAERARRGEAAAKASRQFTVTAMRDGMIAVYASVVRSVSGRVAA
jgi:glycosyltransferase involved in cell wall biosynthesis